MVAWPASNVDLALVEGHLAPPRLLGPGYAVSVLHGYIMALRISSMSSRHALCLPRATPSSLATSSLAAGTRPVLPHPISVLGPFWSPSIHQGVSEFCIRRRVPTTRHGLDAVGLAHVDFFTACIWEARLGLRWSVRGPPARTARGFNYTLIVTFDANLGRSLVLWIR